MSVTISLGTTDEGLERKEAECKAILSLLDRVQGYIINPSCYSNSERKQLLEEIIVFRLNWKSTIDEAKALVDESDMKEAAEMVKGNDNGNHDFTEHDR